MKLRLKRRTGQVLWAVIDDADAPLIEGHAWRPLTNRHVTYVATNAVTSDGQRTTLYLHTLLTGWPFVDHVDGDGLNNRRNNLRPSDRSRNMQNSRPKGASSTYKGVHFRPRYGTWVARIQKPGSTSQTWLGSFVTEEEAARAYDTAARAHFGNHARLNFPD